MNLVTHLRISDSDEERHQILFIEPSPSTYNTHRGFPTTRLVFNRLTGSFGRTDDPTLRTEKN